VPIKGAWISCIAMSFISFFLDLEQLTKLISIGNLTIYSFVCAGVIALRFRGEDSVGKRVKNEKYAWYYFVSAFCFALSLGYRWPMMAQIPLGIITGVLLIYLHFIPQPYAYGNPNHFNCPLVPLIPSLGVFFNFLLCAGLDFMTWVYFGIFLIIGALAYFTYGFKHSRLNNAIYHR
jgi:APA family basic amino acid/polyamine antiporter